MLDFGNAGLISDGPNPDQIRLRNGRAIHKRGLGHFLGRGPGERGKPKSNCSINAGQRPKFPLWGARCFAPSGLVWNYGWPDLEPRLPMELIVPTADRVPSGNLSNSGNCHVTRNHYPDHFGDRVTRRL